MADIFSLTPISNIYRFSFCSNPWYMASAWLGTFPVTHRTTSPSLKPWHSLISFRILSSRSPLVRLFGNMDLSNGLVLPINNTYKKEINVGAPELTTTGFSRVLLLNH